MALNLDLAPYHKAIESGSKLKDELVQHKQMIPGHICDAISASQKIIYLGQDASTQAEASRKFYLNQIKATQQPLEDVEWTAPALPIAKEFIESIKSILNPPAPATKEKITK